MSEVHCVVKAG